jgi:putative ABC transport system ATP-binding protein
VTTELRIDDLLVTIGGRTVVDHLSIDVLGGAILIVTGPPASGKTTLVEVIAGRRAPAAGEVLLDAAPVTTEAVRHKIGYIPQDIRIIDTLTAVENVALTALAHGRSARDAWRDAGAQLDRLGLASSAHHNLAEQLSGGQRQRVAVARATVTRPPLLVADDPTSELDPDSARLVLAVMQDLAENGSAVVLATSDPMLATASARQLHLRAQAAGETHTGRHRLVSPPA